MQYERLAQIPGNGEEGDGEDGRYNGVMLHNTINFQYRFEVRSQNLPPKKKKRGLFAGQRQ